MASVSVVHSGRVDGDGCGAYDCGDCDCGGGGDEHDGGDCGCGGGVDGNGGDDDEDDYGTNFVEVEIH